MRFTSGSIGCAISLSVCLMLLGLDAHADDDGGFFAGANLGRAPIETNNALYQTQLEASASGSGTLEFTKASLSKRDAAGWVDGGYMIWPYVGVEASYFYFGRVFNQVAGSFTPTAGTAESVYASTLLESRGPALGMLLRLPLTESIAVNVRLADYYARTSLTTNLITSSHFPSRMMENGSSLLGGIGVAYTFDGHWSANADFIRVNNAGNGNTMKYDIDMLSVGASYAF